MVTPRSSATVKSDRPCRPGSCRCGKYTSLSSPCRARHSPIRRSRVRRTRSGTASGPYSSCSASKMVTAKMPLSRRSSSSARDHTAARGSSRVRQVLGVLRCDGGVGSWSIFRAVRSEKPAIAAAAACVRWGSFCHVQFYLSVGDVKAGHLARVVLRKTDTASTTFGTDRQGRTTRKREGSVAPSPARARLRLGYARSSAVFRSGINISHSCPLCYMAERGDQCED